MYFLIFNCFTFNKSINKVYNDMKDLSQQLNETETTLNTISKVYQLLRVKLSSIYHEQWIKNLLGLLPSASGVPRVEIDEIDKSKGR